jgi:hypothetical protein
VDLGIHPTLNILHAIVNKGKQQWQNIFQQKLTATIEVFHAVLDSGVVHIVTAHYYTDTQLVSN